MATASFTKNFVVTKKTAPAVLKALNESKTVSIKATQKIIDVKKSEIKKFFGME